jgi:hypothetical protein
MEEEGVREMGGERERTCQLAAQTKHFRGDIEASHGAREGEGGGRERKERGGKREGKRERHGGRRVLLISGTRQHIPFEAGSSGLLSWGGSGVLAGTAS